MQIPHYYKKNSTKGDTIKGTILSPMRNFLSQMNFFIALEAITFLTSIVE